MVTIYFSGTGNTQYIAQQFSMKMGAKCFSIEEKMDFNSVFEEEESITVCYPIYGSLVPRIMREFIEEHKEVLVYKKWIILCTQMMFSGDGAKAFTRLLNIDDQDVLYAEHFNMPNNICNFFLFPIRDSEKKRKVKVANSKLDKVCQNIKCGIIKKRGWGKFSGILGKMQNRDFPKIEQKKKNSFACDEDCNRCGLCVRVCPVGNLSMTNQGIAQADNCILCYRCVNRCPQKAATVMLHVKPKRQYLFR